jgi:DNA-binding transcriptional LysR family regulator
MPVDNADRRIDSARRSGRYPARLDVEPGMELRHLRYAVTLAEELHFGRAAARLGVQQPPLSQQLKALEAELGVRLFERTSRRVTLTEAGQAFLGPARAALEHAERAAKDARQAAAGETGRLRVGFVGTAGRRLLPRVLHSFAAKFPAVELSLRELPTAEQVEALHAGSLDVGFVRPPVASGIGTALTVEPIAVEPLVVALPPRHRLAGVVRVPVERLAGEPFVLFPRAAGPGLHDQILSLCQAAGFRPRVAQRAVTMQTIVGLVSGGLGVSIVPATAAVSDGMGGGAVFRPLASKAPAAVLALACRPDDDRPVLRNFRHVARELSTLPGQ